MEQAPMTPGKVDRSPDIEGVHRIFSALSAFLDAVSAQFQIIVTSMPVQFTWAGCDTFISLETGERATTSS